MSPCATQVEVKSGEKEKKEKCPVYFDGETVRGQVRSDALVELRRRSDSA